MQDMKLSHNCSEEIKSASLSVTPARIATMQLFESHEKPLDAQHLFDHLQKDLAIDRVTVFRILNAFVEKGLIRKIEFGEGKARYELNNEDHHHFICTSCGDITDVQDTVMMKYIKELEKKYSFMIKEHSLEFFGQCSKCQKKGKSN